MSSESYSEEIIVLSTKRILLSALYLVQDQDNPYNTINPKMRKRAYNEDEHSQYSKLNKVKVIYQVYHWSINEIRLPVL
jgi:hypothetical protein